jgi:acetoin utilization deacetylase AcuC-like enzyme
VAELGHYTADTACPIGPGTFDAAMGAAACALAAAAEAAAGRTAYALCRPPGHHAYASRAGGHCYLNNAAIAAEALRRAGAARVAVLDIDSHHGNGTQGIFWARGDVLTVSVHADPDRYYPWYVGRAGERGAGGGEGRNLNLPLPFGTGDEGWLAAIATGIAAIGEFRADALALPRFDASEHEPLNALAVTEDGFAPRRPANLRRVGCRRRSCKKAATMWTCSARCSRASSAAGPAERPLAASTES